MLDADPFPELLADGGLDSLHCVELICRNDHMRLDRRAAFVDWPEVNVVGLDDALLRAP